MLSYGNLVCVCVHVYIHVSMCMYACACACMSVCVPTCLLRIELLMCHVSIQPLSYSPVWVLGTPTAVSLSCPFVPELSI